MLEPFLVGCAALLASAYSAPLQRAILEDPQSLEARLTYAQTLEKTDLNASRFIEAQVKLAQLLSDRRWETLEIEEIVEVKNLATIQNETFNPSWAGELPPSQVIWEAGAPQGLVIHSPADYQYAEKMPFLIELELGEQITSVGKEFKKLLPQLRRLTVRAKSVDGLVEAFESSGSLPLTHLSLSGGYDFVPYLHEATNLPQLQYFATRGAPNDTMVGVLANPHFNLKEVHLPNSLVSGLVLGALFFGPYKDTLTALTIGRGSGAELSNQIHQLTQLQYLACGSDIRCSLFPNHPVKPIPALVSLHTFYERDLMEALTPAFGRRSEEPSAQERRLDGVMPQRLPKLRFASFSLIDEAKGEINHVVVDAPGNTVVADVSHWEMRPIVADFLATPLAEQMRFIYHWPAVPSSRPSVSAPSLPPPGDSPNYLQYHYEDQVRPQLNSQFRWPRLDYKQGF